MAFKYDIFISYSHKDDLFVEALTKRLTGYLPPKGVTTERKRLSVFRDKDEAKGNTLSKEIAEALQQSKKLIIVCSPDGAASKWVHKEVATFSNNRSIEDIIPVLSKGDPSVSVPSLLIELFKGEPWAPDFRYDNIKKLKLPDKSWYHLIACIYGVDRSVIEAREKKRKQRQMITSSLAACIVIIGLSLLAWQWQQTKIREMEKESVQLAYRANSSSDPSDALSLALAALLKSETTDAQNALDAALQKMFSSIKDREEENFSFFFQSVYAVDTASGKIFISSSLGSAVLYNFKTGEKRAFTKENLVPFVKASFSNNGRLLATVDIQKTLIIWNVEGTITKKVSYKIEKDGDMGSINIIFSGDDKRIFIHPYKTNITIRGVEDTLYIKHLDVGSFYDTKTVFNNSKTLIAVKIDTPQIVSFNDGKIIWPQKGTDGQKLDFVGFSREGNMFLLRPRDPWYNPFYDKPKETLPSDSLVLVKLNDKLEVIETLTKKAEAFDHAFMLTHFNVEELTEYVDTMLVKKNTSEALDGWYPKFKVWPHSNILAGDPDYKEKLLIFSFDSLHLLDAFSLSHFRINGAWFANDRFFINGRFEDSTKEQKLPVAPAQAELDSAIFIADTLSKMTVNAQVKNQDKTDYKMIVYSFTQKKILNIYSSGSDIHFAQSGARFISLYKCDTAGKEGCYFINFFDANTGKQYDKIPYSNQLDSRVDDGILYLSYGGDQAVIKADNEFIFYNAGQGAPQRIDLYNNDAKELAADQKAVAEKSPLQVRIHIAKKWLSK